MASVKPISSDFECGICSDMYKDPKILDCQHTFCLQCLQDYIAKTNPRSRLVPCPVCSRKTKLPNTGARGLKTSLYMVSLMEDLARQDKMDSSQLGPRFKQEQGVDDTNLGQLVTPRRWELCRKFGKYGSGPRMFLNVSGIAAGRHDEIAVVDFCNRRVLIFGVDGTYKCKIDVRNSLSVHGPIDVVFAKQSNRLIVVCNSHVKVFNQDNSLAFQFSTVPPDEVGKTRVELRGVAVSEDGNLLIADEFNKVVTEHSPTGALIRTIPVAIPPYFLVARTDGGLIISSGTQNPVNVTDGDGTTLFSIQPTILGQPVGHCKGVCSDHSGIYIAVTTLGYSTGHIHHYDAQGAFISCILQNLYCIHRITMTPAGQLVVGDLSSVQIYQ